MTHRSITHRSITHRPITHRPMTHRALLAGGGALLAAVTGLSAPAQAAGPAGAAAPAFIGNAFGDTITAGSVVTSGRSALVVLGCSNVPGTSESNSSAGVHQPGVAVSGAVATTAMTSAGPTTSATTARTQGVDLLGGMITADAVEAASTTTRTGSAVNVSDTGTTFVNLLVAGQGMPVTPTPNMRVDLPGGIGYVVLDEQKTTRGGTSTSLTVNALHVVITQQNAGGIAVGTNIVISHAVSGLTKPVNGVLAGHAYGTRLSLAAALDSGPSFEEFMPCLGTDGAVRDNTGAGVTISSALTTGAITDTAKGTVAGTSATGETTSTVDRAAVMGSVVKATVIKADAHAVKTAGGTTFSDAGSGFGSLSVNGQSMSADQPPNTTMSIPGVGTLYLHRVLRHSSRIEVRMIELVLTDPSGNLPAGADLVIGESSVSVG